MERESQENQYEQRDFMIIVFLLSIISETVSLGRSFACGISTNSN